MQRAQTMATGRRISPVRQVNRHASNIDEFEKPGDASGGGPEVTPASSVGDDLYVKCSRASARSTRRTESSESELTKWSDADQPCAGIGTAETRSSVSRVVGPICSLLKPI